MCFDLVLLHLNVWCWMLNNFLAENCTYWYSVQIKAPLTGWQPIGNMPAFTICRTHPDSIHVHGLWKIIADPRKVKIRTNTMVFIQGDNLIDCQDAENIQYYVSSGFVTHIRVYSYSLMTQQWWHAMSYSYGCHFSLRLLPSSAPRLVGPVIYWSHENVSP